MCDTTSFTAIYIYIYIYIYHVSIVSFMYKIYVLFLVKPIKWRK